MVNKFKYTFIIIILSSLCAALVSAFFVEREANKYITDRFGSNLVQLQIKSEDNMLVYVVNSNYSKMKDDDALQIKKVGDNTFIINKDQNEDRPQWIYITIKRDQKVISNFVIQLSLFKADAIHPSKTEISVHLKYKNNIGTCSITCARHEEMFSVKKQNVTLKLKPDECPIALFEM